MKAAITDPKFVLFPIRLKVLFFKKIFISWCQHIQPISFPAERPKMCYYSWTISLIFKSQIEKKIINKE